MLPLLGRAQPAPANGWQPDAGLGGLMLRTLVSTAEGLLWVGTDDGVYRYDGTRLVALNALRRDGAVLPAVPCNHLLPLPQGQLWLGTEAGLYRFGPTGRLEPLPLPAPDGSSHAIEAVVLAPGGRQVWVAQAHSGLRAYTLAGQPIGPLVKNSDELQETWPAPDGSLWLVSHGVTRQLSAGGQELGRWHTAPQACLRPAYDPRGQPWLLSTAAAYRAGPGGRLDEQSRWDESPPEQGAAMVRNAAGPTVLLQRQVLQLEWTPGPAPRLRARFALPLPFRPPAAWRGQLQPDHAGHWWVFDMGTHGCWQWAAAAAFIHALPGPDGAPYSVRASVRLPDGRLLVSSYGKGILTQAADSPLAPLRRWKTATLPAGNAPVLMGLVPAPLGPGGSWLAAGVFPLLQFNLRTGAFNRLPMAGQPQLEPGVRALVRDAATHRVWAGTPLGLLYYDAASRAYRPYRAPGQPATAPPPLAGRLIEAVCPDGQGHLWLATPEGVERLTLATGHRESFGPQAPAARRVAVDGARCLYLAPDGRLWVGTHAHGLAVIDPDGRGRMALSQHQGLPNAPVVTITPSAGGYLWLGTYQGLVRYQPASGRLAVFTTAHGLASNECNSQAASVDPRDGSLLVGGVAGLHRVYPDRVPGTSAVPPRLLLTGYTTLATAAEASRPYYLLAADSLPALQLGPGLPLVDLQLALTNSLDPGQARYAYRLRGWLADRWLGLGTTPQLRLQGLPPGNYTVEIRAESGQGVRAANILRLPLTVTAEWWNRPLTWVLAAVAASAAVYGWQRARLRQLRRENDLRARLAADLHDEVGSLLTRVTMQAELLHALEQGPPARLATLVEDSRAAASTVRDIIWSVDAGVDTLAALVDRMRDHLDATARATGRELLLDENLPTGPEQPLPPTLRQHTYLIFKEAVTNALKYSEPGTPIRVSLGCTPLLELRIRSTGAGTGAPGRAGQGLRNMRHRAALLRAELTVGPVPGGWQVRLRQRP
ncbi:sensor histidine kinase [Hymenobacter armeniacus]|uniref:sensor histidine kinase n=1 Tax=Hymenobacter armeniacus TaxID=2771358 RepID=UPI001CC23DD9|nr:sensor histidine kinase [Hymenobacter armeniacus]